MSEAQHEPITLQPDDAEVHIFAVAEFAREYQDKLDLLGAGIAALQTPRLPWILPTMFVAARVALPTRLLGQRVRSSIRLILPSGEPAEIDPVNDETTLLEGHRLSAGADRIHLHIVQPMTNFPIRAEGTHIFQLELGGLQLGRRQLRVQLRQQ